MEWIEEGFIDEGEKAGGGWMIGTTVTIPLLIILSVKGKDLVLACLQVGVTMQERSTRKGTGKRVHQRRAHSRNLLCQLRRRQGHYA